MAINHYAMVTDMREAIYNGYEFDDFYVKGDYGCTTRKRAKAVWHRAQTTVDHVDAWHDYILSQIKPMFQKVADAMDDFYNEGFSLNDLSEALGISKEAVAEIVQKIEMG